MGAVLCSLLETYMRHVKVGRSEGWFGADVVTCLLEPDSRDEVAVISWVIAQDDVDFIDIVRLQSGLDFVVMRRKHTRQSREDALQERDTYIRQTLDSTTRAIG